MTIHRALIVDDSKTAQFKLSSLLKSYDLQVDTAKSAEEALGYLSYNMPAVIFMDHHMEGMDGLEALKILKANPSTSTIPVIMYTSKQDGVYAGHAHALGALDIISKEIMHPSTVESSLAKLGILPKPKYDLDLPEEQHKDNTLSSNDSRYSGETIKTPVTQTQSFEITTLSDSENLSPSNPDKSQRAAQDQDGKAHPDEIKTQVAKLFELHIADVRTQISKNSKFMLRKLIGEIKRSAQHEKESTDGQTESISETHTEQTRSLTSSSNILLFLIFIGLIFIAIQQSRTQSNLNKLEEKFASLPTVSERNNTNIDEVFSNLRGSSADEPSLLGVASILSWAMNTNLNFDYHSQALTEEQVMVLQNLVYQLNSLGFNGIIALNIHLGNFCLERKDQNDWQLAKGNLPVTECLFSNSISQSLTIDDFITHSYVQFEQTTAPIRNGLIEILISISEIEDSLFPYPNQDSTITAKEWNQIAQKNNRLSISIEPNI